MLLLIPVTEQHWPGILVKSIGELAMRLGLGWLLTMGSTTEYQWVRSFRYTAVFDYSFHLYLQVYHSACVFAAFYELFTRLYPEASETSTIGNPIRKWYLVMLHSNRRMFIELQLGFFPRHSEWPFGRLRATGHWCLFNWFP